MIEEKLDLIIELLGRVITLQEKAADPTMYNGFRRWDQEQEDYLAILTSMDLSPADIAEQFKIALDVERSVGAIISRQKRLGLHYPVQEAKDFKLGETPF